MPVIVVGGHARRTGKTSVIAGIIAALRDFQWTAVKLTPHAHGAAALVTEETDPEGSSDTQRYLAAGAARAYLVRTGGREEAEVREALLRLQAENRNVILEGNRAAGLVEPDLCLAVLRYDLSEFKESAERLLERAHAAAASGYNPAASPWPPPIMRALARIPVYPVHPPDFTSCDLIQLINKI